MKKSCLLWLVSLAALWVGLEFYFKDQFHSDESWIAAGVSSLFLMFTWGCLQNARLAGTDRRAIALAERGQLPKDGDVIAAVGTIHPVGQPLLTPFTQQPCVFFEYGIGHESQDSDGHTHRVNDFNGFELTPSRIRTRAGEIKLLAMPLLEGFPENISSAAEVMSRADAYVKATQFEKIGVMQLKKMMEVFADDDGAIKKDWTLTDGKDIDGLEVSEKYVPVGEQVCALGIYSRMKGGIISDLKGRGSVVRLMSGDAKSLSGKLRTRAIGYVIASFVCLGIAAIPPFVLSLQPQKGDASSSVNAPSQN